MLDVITELVVWHVGVEFGTQPKDVIHIVADGFVGQEGVVT